MLLHCVMPNSDVVVVPYPTKKIAHASYVLSQEANASNSNDRISKATYSILLRNMRAELEQNAREHECKHGDGDDEAKHDCHSGGDEAKHDTVGDEANHGHAEEEGGNPPLRNANFIKPSEYRYGNSLLGLKSQMHQAAGVASYSTFMAVWNDKERPYQKHLLVRKWLPFAKCDVCSELRRKRDASDDKVERDEIKLQYEEHIKFVRKERAVYYERQRMAVDNPDQYMSMIIDGADQSKYSLPHFHHRTHKTEGIWKNKMHVMGAIVHGLGSFLYTCPSHAAQGHNVTIQALFRTLLKLKQDGHQLPPKLYLQMDNTTKQCKVFICSFFNSVSFAQLRFIFIHVCRGDMSVPS
jgi:hypothetical protein